MKKIYFITLLILSSVSVWAQSFTITGPRTFYSTVSAKNTTLYFSFDKGKFVPNTDPWDLSLATTSGSYAIAFNTSVEGQLLADTSFSKVTAAPASGYATTISNTFATGTFKYDPANHIVSPIAGKVLVIKLADGRYVKMELLSLYRKAPIAVQDLTPTQAQALGYLSADFGFPSFRYLVSAASSTDLSQQVTTIKNLVVSATGSGTYKMVNFAIADTTINADDRWNFRVQGRTFETNTTGGNSAELLSTAFNSITSATSIGTPVSPLVWSRYNGPTGPGQDPAPHTHVIYTKPNTTIVFKDSLGRFGKIVIESYYKNAPAVACTDDPQYYTMKYYYNAYGNGETLAKRNGNDLTTNATLNVTVFPTLTLSDETLEVPVAGFTSAETVSVTSTSSWTASTTAAWITLAGTTGTNNGSFTLTTTANTSVERTGTIDVTYCNGAKKSITVTQDEVVTSVRKALSEKISVYPNPASDRFVVNLGSVQAEQMSVSNMEGRELLNVVSPTTDYEINTQQWNKGIYFLKVSTSEGVAVKKIQVQ